MAIKTLYKRLGNQTVLADDHYMGLADTLERGFDILLPDVNTPSGSVNLFLRHSEPGVRMEQAEEMIVNYLVSEHSCSPMGYFSSSAINPIRQRGNPEFIHVEKAFGSSAVGTQFRPVKLVRDPIDLGAYRRGQP